MNDFNFQAAKAAKNELAMEEFILQHESFILKCASSTTHTYITKSDDEWSIALSAFIQAVESYDINKGSFYSFAELVIGRRLIDYIRSQSRFNKEISVGPEVFDSDPNEEQAQPSLQAEVSKKISYTQKNDLQLEIESITECLLTYGFTFYDLVSCSPKAEKTKKSCAKAINYLLKNPLLIMELQATKLLPLKIIEKNGNVPRKILERHRKYIIAAVEILSGEYPELADYMRYIREEID